MSLDAFLFNRNDGKISADGTGTYQIITKTDAQAEDPKFKHYGYMEFINENKKKWNENDFYARCKSFGGALMAAYIFGLKDMHHENIIIGADRVNLIDMEAALGNFSSFRALDMNDQVFEKLKEGVPENRKNNDFFRMAINKIIAGAGQKFGELAPLLTEEVIAAYSKIETRYVPFSTRSLQNACALYSQDFEADNMVSREQYDRLVNIVISENGQGYLTVDGARSLLEHRDTKAAFARGDVPFWTRKGNTIYSDNGNIIVRVVPVNDGDKKIDMQLPNDSRLLSVDGIKRAMQNRLQLLRVGVIEDLEQFCNGYFKI